MSRCSLLTRTTKRSTWRQLLPKHLHHSHTLRQVITPQHLHRSHTHHDTYTAHIHHSNYTAPVHHGAYTPTHSAAPTLHLHRPHTRQHLHCTTTAAPKTRTHTRRLLALTCLLLGWGSILWKLAPARSANDADGATRRWPLRGP